MITAPLVLLPHNWAESVTRRLSWKTDILIPLNGVEYRRRLRKEPIETLTYHLTLLGQEEHARLVSMLWGSPNLRVAVPRWEDAAMIMAPVSIGDTVVIVNRESETLQFISDAVIYWEGEEDYEAVLIDAATGPTITFLSGTTKAWPSGVIIVPVVHGYVSAPVAGEDYGQLKGNDTLTVRLEEDIAGVTTDTPGATMLPATITVGSEAIGQEGTIAPLDAQAVIVNVFDAFGNMIPDPEITASFDPMVVDVYPTGEPGIFNIRNLWLGGGRTEDVTFTSGSVSVTVGIDLD